MRDPRPGISSEGDPSFSLRSLQGQGGVLAFPDAIVRPQAKTGLQWDTRRVSGRFLNEEDGMKSPCAVNLHNAVTESQQPLGKRVAQLSSACRNEACAALSFSPGCDAN